MFNLQSFTRVNENKCKFKQEIATTEDCEAAGVAPLLRARGRQARALISHMNAVSARRKELAAFFTKNGFCSLSAEELASRMDRYGTAKDEIKENICNKMFPSFAQD